MQNNGKTVEGLPFVEKEYLFFTVDCNIIKIENKKYKAIGGEPVSNSRYVLERTNPASIRSNARLRNVGSARYDGDWHSIPHTHGYAELFYILGGDGQFRIEDDLYPVKTDQLVIVNPNVLHTEVSYESRPMEYIVLGIEGLELSMGKDTDSRFTIVDYRSGGDVLTCMRHILRESQEMQAGHEVVCQAYLEILIVRLMRNISLAMPPIPVDKRCSRQCAIVRRYIDTHYKEQLNLDTLAQQAHVNKYYMVHSFKQEYGVSPIQYLNQRRMEESRYLLQETDLSLTQISRVLGFSSASYFSQSFLKAEGLPPMEYRKRCKKDTL